VDWTGLAQDRDKIRALVNLVMNFRLLYIAGKLSSGCQTCGVKKCAQLQREN
jgi:hypothetical protein